MTADSIIGRTIREYTGLSINHFYHFENTVRIPGYIIIGLLADDEAVVQNNMKDMGFAVFRQVAENECLLVSCYVYGGAAVTESGIFAATDPAATEIHGVSTPENTYDILFASREDLAYMTLTLADGTVITHHSDGRKYDMIFLWRGNTADST